MSKRRRIKTILINGKDWVAINTDETGNNLYDFFCLNLRLLMFLAVTNIPCFSLVYQIKRNRFFFYWSILGGRSKEEQLLLILNNW